MALSSRERIADDGVGYSLGGSVGGWVVQWAVGGGLGWLSGVTVTAHRQIK